MRTQAQIVARIRFLQSNYSDQLGFQREVFYSYLDFANAKEFLKGDGTAEKEQWEIDGIPQPPCNEFILEEMAGSISWAWDAVRHHKSSTTRRMVFQLRAWLWLLEDETMIAKIDAGHPPFKQFGAPILASVCAQYSLRIPSDNPKITNMIVGYPCSPDCVDGCER